MTARSPLTDAHALLALADAATNKVTDLGVPDRLVDRLRGKYASGPTLENGEPEFGYRTYASATPINLEAADALDAVYTLAPALARDVIAMAEEVERLRAALLRISDPKQADRGDIARAALSGKASADE